ncbi:TPA: hypothetical protein I9059_001651 [Clostridium perfringens]|nr:hypothetical protein [Clostridium perfringens]
MEKYYAIRSKSSEVLNKCTSGGAFITFSDYVLDNGGAIACSVYDYENHQVVFKLIEKKSDRDKACGSKYIQSIPGNIFKECLKWLENNSKKELIFIGTPCQTHGFQKYIEANYKCSMNIYYIDMICHGVPSPKIWKEYINLKEIEHSGKVDYVSFRDKRNGWDNPTSYALINGKEVGIGEFNKIFYSRKALRDSCYKCPYATTIRRSDITIGDYWGMKENMPEFYDSIGTSLVITHTDKGERLLKSVSNKLIIRESDKKHIMQPNLLRPTKKHIFYSKFWLDYNKRGIKYIINKYGTFNKKNEIYYSIKKVLLKMKG